MCRLGWICQFLLIVVFLCASNCSTAQSTSVIELQRNWKLISADKLTDSGAAISRPGYATAKWYPIRQMPATVLAVLQDDGIYPNLYYGMNLLTKVPQDLWKQDWWYRTSFWVPPGKYSFWIDFPGINYRAEIWLNGKLIASEKQAVGMYSDHNYEITKFIYPGTTNILAVKVTPERLIRDVNGVELADSWHDWINWNYLGYKGPLNIRDLPLTGFTGKLYGAGKLRSGYFRGDKDIHQSSFNFEFNLGCHRSLNRIPIEIRHSNLHTRWKSDRPCGGECQRGGDAHNK